MYVSSLWDLNLQCTYFVHKKVQWILERKRSCHWHTCRGRYSQQLHTHHASAGTPDLSSLQKNDNKNFNRVRYFKNYTLRVWDLSSLKNYCVTLIDFLPQIKRVTKFLKKGDLFLRSPLLSLWTQKLYQKSIEMQRGAYLARGREYFNFLISLLALP